MLSPDEIPRDASSFMTTTRQSPSSGSQSIVRSPEPFVEVTQNSHRRAGLSARLRRVA